MNEANKRNNFFIFTEITNNAKIANEWTVNNFYITVKKLYKYFFYSQTNKLIVRQFAHMAQLLSHKVLLIN